jgi:hypothetical protein
MIWVIKKLYDFTINNLMINLTTRNFLFKMSDHFKKSHAHIQWAHNS